LICSPASGIRAVFKEESIIINLKNILASQFLAGKPSLGD
jgi:hypothetical protein